MFFLCIFTWILLYFYIFFYVYVQYCSTSYVICILFGILEGFFYSFYWRRGHVCIFSFIQTEKSFVPSIYGVFLIKAINGFWAYRLCFSLFFFAYYFDTCTILKYEHLQINFTFKAKVSTIIYKSLHNELFKKGLNTVYKIIVQFFF